MSMAPRTLWRRADRRRRASGRADFVAQKAEDLVVGLAACPRRWPAICSRTRRLGPLLLVFVELLQVHEGIAVPRIEPDDFLERLERAVDEAAVLVVEAEAEQHVGVLDRRRGPAAAAAPDGR